MKKEKFKLFSTVKKCIGHCAVDSGTLIIVDPCYLADWKDGEYDDPKNSYGKTCAVSLNDQHAGEVVVAPPGGSGVVFESGFGDGAYPVFATYKDYGTPTRGHDVRICKVEVKLIED